MTTEVICKCGRLIDSTTVTKMTYKRGDVVDYGCPYCGPKAPLRATATKRKKKETIDEPEPL